MSEVNLGVSPTITALESSSDMASVIANSSPVVKRAADSAADTPTSQPLFSAGFSDPLDLIDDLLSMYIETQTQAADELAQEIEKKSDAIAEINRLWGLIMQQAMESPPKDFEPAKGGVVDISEYKTTKDGKEIVIYDELNRIIVEDLNDPDGIGVFVTTDEDNVTYDELQEMNASMTAYCGKIQVELDTQQQEFKNMMTEVSSAQEELRDVRRSVVSMSQQG